MPHAHRARRLRRRTRVRQQVPDHLLQAPGRRARPHRRSARRGAFRSSTDGPLRRTTSATSRDPRLELAGDARHICTSILAWISSSGGITASALGDVPDRSSRQDRFVGTSARCSQRGRRELVFPGFEPSRMRHPPWCRRGRASRPRGRARARVAVTTTFAQKRAPSLRMRLRLR